MAAIFENREDNTFSFKNVSPDEITKEMKSLDVKKDCQDTIIVTQVNKNNSDIFADFFFLNPSSCIALPLFSSNLKTADIISVHKRDSKNTESNYRPVSGLTNILKIYETCIFFQILI